MLRISIPINKSCKLEQELSSHLKFELWCILIGRKLSFWIFLTISPPLSWRLLSRSELRILIMKYGPKMTLQGCSSIFEGFHAFCFGKSPSPHFNEYFVKNLSGLVNSSTENGCCKTRVLCVERPKNQNWSKMKTKTETDPDWLILANQIQATLGQPFRLILRLILIGSYNM